MSDERFIQIPLKWFSIFTRTQASILGTIHQNALHGTQLQENIFWAYLSLNEWRALWFPDFKATDLSKILIELSDYIMVPNLQTVDVLMRDADIKYYIRTDIIKIRKQCGEKDLLNESLADMPKAITTHSSQDVKRIRSKPMWFKLFYGLYPQKRRGGSDQYVWRVAKQMRITEKTGDLIVKDLKRRLVEDDTWRQGFIPGITNYLRREIWKTPIIAPDGSEAQSIWFHCENLYNEEKDNDKETEPDGLVLDSGSSND